MNILLLLVHLRQNREVKLLNIRIAKEQLCGMKKYLELFHTMETILVVPQHLYRQFPMTRIGQYPIKAAANQETLLMLLQLVH